MNTNNYTDTEKYYIRRIDDCLDEIFYNCESLNETLELGDKSIITIIRSLTEAGSIVLQRLTNEIEST